MVHDWIIHYLIKFGSRLLLPVGRFALLINSFVGNSGYISSN